MTAIVGHRNGWMVSDVATTGNGWIFPFVANKILRFGTHSLVGCAGMPGLDRHCQELQKHHDQSGNVGPDHLIDGLCELQEKYSKSGKDERGRQIVVVTNQKRLVYIDVDAVAHEVSAECSYHIIGSGDETCLGFLAGLQHRENHYNSHKTADICAHDAVEAIRFTSKYNSSVSYATRIEHLT